MKHFHHAILIIGLVLLMASCVTTGVENQTIIGGWTIKDGDYTYNRYFTEDGYYVIEEEADGYYAYEYGLYDKNDGYLFLDGDSISYSLEGNKLILDNVEYHRSTRKAVNNSNRLPGVWENNRYSLGLAKDGLAVSQGSYMACSSFETDDDNSTITIDGKDSDYLIVNNNLYIRNFSFLRSRETLKFQRKSSGGLNKTGKDILCSNGPWFYQNMNTSDLTGDLYAFTFGGSFEGTEIEDGTLGTTQRGNYTLDGNLIHLSTGGTLVFAYIDETPFGYN